MGELAQIPSGESFKLLPQPVGDPAHCRPAQRRGTDGQALLLGRAAPQPGPHPRHERLRTVGDERDTVLDRAFCRRQWAPSMAVPVPTVHGQLQQLCAGVALGHPLDQQLIKLLIRPVRCRNSRRHRGTFSCCRCHPCIHSPYPAISGLCGHRSARFRKWAPEIFSPNFSPRD